MPFPRKITSTLFSNICPLSNFPSVFGPDRKNSDEQLLSRDLVVSITESHLDAYITLVIVCETKITTLWPNNVTQQFLNLFAYSSKVS